MPLQLACPRCAMTVTPTLDWKTHKAGRHLEARCPTPGCNRFLKNVPQDVEAQRLYVDQARDRERQHGPTPRQGELFGGAPETPAAALAPAPDPAVQVAIWLGEREPDPVAHWPTWAELVALEPALASILANAMHAPAFTAAGKRTPSFSRQFYGCCNEKGFKDRVHVLVGPDSGRPGIIGTEAARDVAGLRVYAALRRALAGGRGRPGSAAVPR